MPVVGKAREVPDKAADAGAVINKKLAKVTFFNQNDTDKPLRVMFNPAQLVERLSSNFARQTVPGLSHQVMQFVNTNNLTVDMELFFRATTDDELAEMRVARRKLMSWQYPRANSGAGVIGGGAPQLVVIWPNMLHFQAYLTSIEWTHDRFIPDLSAVESRARVTFEEILQDRITFDNVDADQNNRFDSGFATPHPDSARIAAEEAAR